MVTGQHLVKQGDFWNSVFLRTEIAAIYTMPARNLLINIAREDLLAETRRRYATNQHALQKVDEYAGTCYDLNRAISWYARGSSLYRLLDEACRSESIELMYSDRSVIGDLSEQLQHLPRPGSAITVFRGQLMTPEELEELKLNIGQTVFTNSFLSTTYDEQVACCFSGLGMR